MLEAGLAVLNCHRVLARTGDNIVGELIKGHETFYEWDHYPPGDVYDSDHDSQFYYHAHPQIERVGEHGHFHSFVHPEIIPSAHSPLAEPPPEELEEDEVPLCHLVGISMDSLGIPIRFFTTNRWVTGEILFAAETVSQALDQFEIDLAQPSWPVNLWVTNMIRLFRPQIESLLAARDQVIDDWQRSNPDSNAYEDHELEVTSALKISVDEQIAEIRQILTARGEAVSDIG
jgi:hypothetical protein